MKTLCLNCRGLGQPEAVRELRSLVELHRLQLVFLSETRLFDDKVDVLRRALNFPNGVGVGSFGRGGGLALLWTKELCVQLQTYDKLHIDVMIMDPVTNSELWHFTGFYGDFNEILDASEQFGGVGRLERQMDGFRDVVVVCGFHDLGYVGLPYTWDNRQKGDKNIKVRLDRALMTSSFLDMFADVFVRHIQTMESDHYCLLIDSRSQLRRNGLGFKTFKYENMWRRDPSYKDAVESSWGTGEDVRTLAQFQSERKLMARLAELLSREETMERQRSRINWLKDGDRNTKFFQAFARERSRVNKITGLRTSDGLLATAQSEMERLVVSFYKDLFSAQCNSEPDEVLQHVKARVTDGMNEQLLKPFSGEEVKKALFLMGPNKSPGPDGFTAGFYQHHWEVIGPSLTRSVLDFMNGATVPDGLNQTTVILIPKVKNPQDIKLFRPISRCNVLYKICSKVIANRSKLLLEEVISEEQSAFVSGRIIADNVLVAYEVEWDYLHGMLLKLGFAESFVNLVMKCVTTVSFFVRVNGKLTKSFKPSRGIRQGDPISPYLFLICAEEASQRGVDRIQMILDAYSKGSGQLVNREKSAVFFSKNCSDGMKAVVREALHIEKEALAEKYLGLPTAIGRSKKGVFEYMTGRLRGLVGGWSGKEASCAGREVLLKSVAQAVPTYPMSCFQIPLDTCNKMRSIIANYWWGSATDSKRIHWQKWDHLTRPKKQGGMSFRDLHLFNLAMLGKQGWRLIERPDSLCAWVLKGRYYHDIDFFQTRRRNHASQTWRAILAGREVLKLGLIKRIGDGKSIRIWDDRWIPNYLGGKLITPSGDACFLLVADLLTSEGKWREEFIRENFVHMDAEAILRIPTQMGGTDYWAWALERHGHYSVRSAYKIQYVKKQQEKEPNVASSSANDVWGRIWKVKVPPKVQVFWWRVMHEFLPSRQILRRRHLERLANCERCGADEESVLHVVVECTLAKRFWKSIKQLIGVKLPRLQPFRHGGSVLPIHQAVAWVKDTCFDLWRINHSEGTEKQPVVIKQWEKSEQGWVKCNIDASFSLTNNTGSLGMILRDHNGQCIGGGAKWQVHCLEPLAVEATACMYGMEMARSRGFRVLIIESDCLELVSLWHMERVQRSRITPYFRRMKEL
ncbi:uncharacterized protein LOC121054416 [Oryza brachyantha]|uniref:uncharacterized protein LOC121054416 n=1 Tax=Oryza brachyantha TaxID=4533 RepID=UPI001ADB038D|nr:uncharacterized protein LOC121054416 [Oryza brachyantha]